MSNCEEEIPEEVSDSNSDDDVEGAVEHEAKGADNSSHKRPADTIPVLPSHVSKKMKKNELYKPPTVEELNNLKEAEALFHSSLFRLQIDELMSEVKTKNKAKLQTWLEALKTFLKQLPESELYKIDDTSWIAEGVKVPIRCHRKNKKACFQFLPPNNVQEVGSYVLDTICSPEPVIDLSLQIPRACWRKMDFLNMVYHKKRALYLTYLACLLKESDLIEDMEYSYESGCHLKPVLLLKSKDLSGKRITVRLLPYPERSAFRFSRFAPDRNNVRFSWFYKGKESEGEVEPTPHYNATVLRDILIPSVTGFLKTKITSQSVKDGIILMKVWAIQRGLYGVASSVNGFVIAMIVAHLIEKRKISPMMSSYQVFRNILLFLSRENLLEHGISVCQKEVMNQPSVADFNQKYDVVFVDPSGFLNMCYNFTKESYLMLQHEAQLALKILDSASADSFVLLFMNKVPFCRKFEYLMHFTQVKKFVGYAAALNIQERTVDHCGDLVASVVPKICELIKRGLGNRLHFIDVQVSSKSSWPVSKKAPSVNLSRYVTLGLLMNQELVFNNLEKGPAADSPESREFRHFWGEKSELRRFKDGSIHEAVLWPAETTEEKRHVLPSIVKYVLERHSGVSPKNIVFRGTDVDNALSLPRSSLPVELISYGTGEELFLALLQSFNSLSKELRNLEGLPLAIYSVQGTSPVFRFSEVFPPFSRYYSSKKAMYKVQGDSVAFKGKSKTSSAWVPALEAVIHFEGSGKWPDDKEALNRVKTAFHIKIAELLKSQCNLAASPVPGYLDVLKDGYVFRLEVACHKEIALLKQVKTPEGMLKIEDNTESMNLQCRTEILPRLNSILHGLHQQHNTFGTACRLAKRWVSSQLLHGYIDDVVIELLVAFLYLNPEPYTCPSSPQVAFQRFLGLVHMHDWNASPVIINFNSELNKQEISEFLSTFTSQRTKFPAMAIITPLDKTGSLWTKNSPSEMMLQRFVELANVALELLEMKISRHEPFDYHEIFRPPINPYDVLIHLDSQQVPKRCFAVDTPKDIKFFPCKAYRQKHFEKIPVVGYDPVQLYLQDLRNAFDDLALFFYDAYGGGYIAVLWNPEAFNPRPFKVSHINWRMISASGVNDDGTVNIVPNTEAILEDFAVMGSGLIRSIEKRTEKWAAL